MNFDGLAARRMLAGVLLIALAGCQREGPGAGWSRAPDVSVYAAMVQAGELAREREILCAGANPVTVEGAWQARFGAREGWIADALAARHGRATLARARIQPVGRQDCPAIADHRWRDSHTDLLRLLELRLYPRSWWERAALEGER